jgi:hypothetical protein
MTIWNTSPRWINEEYGAYKRERMWTSGIGAMLERFEKVSQERKK